MLTQGYRKQTIDSNLTHAIDLNRSLSCKAKFKIPGISYAGDTSISKAKDDVELVTVFENSEARKKFPLLDNGFIFNMRV